MEDTQRIYMNVIDETIDRMKKTEYFKSENPALLEKLKKLWIENLAIKLKSSISTTDPNPPHPPQSTTTINPSYQINLEAMQHMLIKTEHLVGEHGYYGAKPQYTPSTTTENALSTQLALLQDPTHALTNIPHHSSTSAEDTTTSKGPSATTVDEDDDDAFFDDAEVVVVEDVAPEPKPDDKVHSNRLIKMDDLPQQKNEYLSTRMGQGKGAGSIYSAEICVEDESLDDDPSINDILPLEPEATDTIIGQLENVTRPGKNNKGSRFWQVSLSAGIMQVGGIEIPFGSLNGEFSWANE